MSKQNFAIVISKYYVSRCISLIDSIIKYDVKIFILCFDKQTLNILTRSISSKKVILTEYKKIINFDKTLKNVIKERKLIDKIVTSRPIFLKYLFKKYFIKNVFLLDSDIYFFSDPYNLKKYIKNSSVAYCEHNFSRKKIELSSKYGKFNGGFVYVKSDKNGISFLNKWSILCKKWCEFNSKDGKFSDQKYLEDLSLIIKNLRILNYPQINLAPWNLEGKNIKLKNNQIFVNKKKLIFFHFHGLRQLSKNFYILGLENYDFVISNKIKKALFYEYVANLRDKSFIKEYFWTKNNYFSRLLKIYIVIRKIFKNDFLILSK